MLTAARHDAPELTEVHRFSAEWEKAASLALRDGDTDVVDTYLARGRIRDGVTEDVVEEAYAAWRTDVEAGRTAVLVADSAETVLVLNERAHHERQASGEVLHTGEVWLAGGMQATVGDWVITRRNARTLRTTSGHWVANGDRWIVTDTYVDGSIRVRPAGQTRGNSITLPSAYVAEHVDLGYAVTAHRAQGLTVDAAHVVVTGSTTRENLYVAMTRGRHANHAYVALDRPDDAHTAPIDREVTGRSVLFGVLQHSGAELSARQTIEAERERWGSISQLAAEYETIAAAAQRPRWEALVRDSSGLDRVDVAEVIASPAFGELCAQLRRVEADGYQPGPVLEYLVGAQPLDDASEVAAVLWYRLDRFSSSVADDGPHIDDHRYVAGIVPEALGDMAPEMRAALDDRAATIEQRAVDLAEAALADDAAWLGSLPPRPASGWRRDRWDAALIAVCAYRDRHGIADAHVDLDDVPSVSRQDDLDRINRLVAAIDEPRRPVGPDPSDSSGPDLGTRPSVGFGVGL
jgi:hypothetical protein